MNTGELHSKIETPAEPVNDISTETDNTLKPTPQQTETKEENVDVNILIDNLRDECRKVIESQNLALAKYEWLQAQIEHHIEVWLRRIKLEHDKQSQIERMAFQIVTNIAKQTISEDESGVTTVNGYNKQYYQEIKSLGELQMFTLGELNTAIAMAIEEDEKSNKARIVEEGVNKKLQIFARQTEEVTKHIYELLTKQSSVIISELESFKALEYFKAEEAWQNPTIRLLIQEAENTLKVIETQRQKLQSQTNEGFDQIHELLKAGESVVVKIAEPER